MKKNENYIFTCLALKPKMKKTKVYLGINIISIILLF